MRRYTNRCEDAIADNYPQGMVDNTSQIARLGNRVLMAAQNEAENSEEPAYCDRVNSAANQVRSGERNDRDLPNVLVRNGTSQQIVILLYCNVKANGSGGSELSAICLYR
ncbi:unnamed protein product [Cylicostephanus goldi]|uniref:Vinculin n=1 Tax=Cylicostephanus goldi TaxID=71465 RepID=A0A3P6RN55_CYLGO|nr:unnamed protein product [Cylicostephanus goldi]